MTDATGHGPTIAINMFKMRSGINSSQFAEFSANVDQPLCLAHSDIVTRFDAFRVPSGIAGELGVDIVEVMHVNDWPAWVTVRDNDPSLRPVMSGFDQLVDPTSVRSSFVIPIVRNHQ